MGGGARRDRRNQHLKIENRGRGAQRLIVARSILRHIAGFRLFFLFRKGQAAAPWQSNATPARGSVQQSRSGQRVSSKIFAVIGLLPVTIQYSIH